ncbi:MAG: tetratricopeptide repeat protein, partial [Candidatus Obscuribacterales bacterium]|nr:tetratricopeptide repeat protein [Candidatus Obscuribacterales bacterium]
MNKKIFCLAAVLSLVSLSNFNPAYAQRSLLITLYSSGVKAYDKGNCKEALRIFRQCQEMSNSAKNPLERSQILYSLGECLRSMGQYKEAEETLKETLKLTDELPRKQRNYFWLFNAMALLYQSQGRFTEAEGMWKQDELLAGKNDPRLAYPVNNLARHYYIWGKLQEETEYVAKARHFAERSRKTIAVPYYILNEAQLAELKGKYPEAEKMYKASLETCSAICGPSHPYCAFILTGLAELYRKQSRYEEAEQRLKEAQKIFETKYASEHPDIAETMVRLAKVLSEEGKYAQARELVKSALKTEESVFGTSDNLFIARAKDCLGNTQRQEGKYTEAKASIEQALAMEQRVLGNDNIEVATVMRDLALVQEDEANYEEAESLLKSSLTTIERQTGPDHPERAAAYNALAHAYLRDNKLAEAEPLFKNAFELAQRVLGSENFVTASSARDLGELYRKQKQFSQAQIYLEKSLNIDKKLFGEKAPQIAADLTSLAYAYAAEGQAEKAQPLLNQAAEIKNVLPGAGEAAAEAPKPFNENAADRPVTDKWALVVGVSNFKDSSINLKFAAKDATDFKNFLVSTEKFRPDHVKLLTDETATRENIIGMLGEKWLAEHVRPDDLVVVYVSSHGSSATTEAGGTNFLVAYDTNKNSLSATGIPMQWLTNIVSEQVRSDRIILILDVCHSGAVGEGQKSLTRTAGLDPQAVKIGKGQMIICSSQANQVSWESKDYENSVFTRRLIESLQ